MLKIYNPQIVFFMETKLPASRMENVRRLCGFLNGFEVSAEGSRRGLSVGWNSSRFITLKSFSKNHIDVEIQEEVDSQIWKFTDFYRAPDVRKKVLTWELL